MRRLLPTLLVFTCSLAFARGENPAVAQALAPYVASNLLAGAIALTVDTNGVIRETCVGWADAEKKIPMTSDRLFWIASMSKTMCAAAVMMLVDEGKLSLDDPAGKYIPEFKNLWVLAGETNHVRTLVRPERPITLRMLLSHTSGLAFLAPFQQGHGTLGMMPLEQLVQAYAEVPLRFQPGTQWGYSNEGVNTAARIVELVSGLPYETFLQKRLFDPLGMKGATFFPTRAQMSRLAVCYSYAPEKASFSSGKGYVHYTEEFPCGRYAEAGGGIFATADDVRRFVQMLLNNGVFEGTRILSEKGVTALHTRQTPAGVKPWCLCCSGDASRYSKGGAYATNMVISPRDGLSFVWMVQAIGDTKQVSAAQNQFIQACLPKEATPISGK